MMRQAAGLGIGIGIAVNAPKNSLSQKERARDIINKPNQTKPNQTVIADTKEKIEMMRLLTIRSGLKLELLGLRHSRNAAFKAAKQITGKNTRREALASLEDLIRSKQ
tara:strand:- start:1293 stop:1616 length:324 start_codon:yes stop_codon:yes gene_type:complete